MKEFYEGTNRIEELDASSVYLISLIEGKKKITIKILEGSKVTILEDIVLVDFDSFSYIFYIPEKSLRLMIDRRNVLTIADKY